MSKTLDINVSYTPMVYNFFESNKEAEIYVIAGGRGKGATWGIGNEIILQAIEEELFIVCTREIKQSVDHSSRRTIERLVRRMGLKKYFTFLQKETICNITGSKFIYTGLSKVTEDNAQGMEGINIAWIGEAHTMEMSTWQKFEPTIRENDAKVYIDYNIQYSHTPIHHLFTENPESYPFTGKKALPELAYLFMTYKDNTLCPEKTKRTAERHKAQFSLLDWNWIWLGHLKDSSDKYVCTDSLFSKAMECVIDRDYEVEKVCGCDIAHMGGDEIVFYKRQGYKFLDDGFKHTLMKTPEVVRELEAYISYDKSYILVIDNGHVGAAVADVMEEKGYCVERIDFGGTKCMHYDPDHSANAATDMAFNFVEKWLPYLDLPKDTILKNQVIQRKWTFKNHKAIRQLESKDDFKKHAVNLEGHVSPDRGDAAFLSCYNRNTIAMSQGIGNMLKAW